MRRIPMATLVTAGLVVLVLVIYAIAFQVRFSEAAVKVRLGKADRQDIITTPGFYWKLPAPFETVQKFDIRLRTLDTLEGEVKTRDGKNVVVGCYAVWRIADPLTFKIKAQTVRQAEEALRARVNQRRAAVIGTEDLSAFVNLNEALVNGNYDRIEDTILNGREVERGDDVSLKDKVLSDFGIELVQVRIRRISLPEETTQSIFQQMSAERQKEAARFREEGKSRAQTITAQAEAARQDIMSFANRKAAEIQSRGIRASTTILKQISEEDAEFFEWLRWLDALSVALRQKSTIFLDSRSALFDPFVRPPTTRPAGRLPMTLPAGQLPTGE